MKTILKSYYFDTRNKAERLAYDELKAVLTAREGATECFCTWGGKGDGHYSHSWLEGVEVELETKHIFDNQWNTAPFGNSKSGRRVFDWAEDYPIDFSPKIKKGHYLILTQDMLTLRNSVCQCGYCGHQVTGKAPAFHLDCLGSEYLTKEYLQRGAIRYYPVTRKDWKPLTDDETAELVPLFVEAQVRGRTEGDKKRIAKQRADLAHEYEETISHAKAKRDGFLWLMDHGVNVNNVIYYSHTGKFSFGWRKEMSAEEIDAWLAIASEFPFDYEFSKESGYHKRQKP